VRKRLKLMKNSARKSRRLLAITIFVAATAILAAGAATVVSRRNAVARQQPNNQAAKPAAASASGKNYMTVKVAGQEVQIDSETGQMKQLTPEEAKKLAAGLKQVINRSEEGLVPVQHPDGSVSVDLQGRFQNVTVARVNDDGTVSTSCVDNAQSAGEFFGIDPQLIENPEGNRTTKRVVPLRTTNQDK
jgi:hypothetical protein